MDFNADKPIFLQIADSVCDRILSGELNGEDRIPSVREFGADIGVNPNTVMRTYDYLQNAEIIYNRRGVGYFVEPKAGERIRKMHRQEFLDDELPYFVQRMNMLGFTWEELINESKTIQR